MRPELQGIVDEAARLLAAPITLEDRRFDLVAYGSQRPDVDAVRQESIFRRRSSAAVQRWFEQFGITRSTGPVLTPADPVLGIRPRLCLPARFRGVTYGYLWAYDWVADVRPALTGPEVTRAMELAEHAGSYLAAQSRQRESAAGMLADLLASDPETAATAALAVEDAGLLRRGTAVVAVVAGTVAPSNDVSVNLWRLPRAVLADSRGTDTTLLVPIGESGNLQAADDVARRVLELYTEAAGPAGRETLVAGIGAPRTDLRDVRASWREARLALRVAAGVPEQRPVARWDELGVYRLLDANPGAGLLLDAPVERLLAEPELTRTARTFLDLAGSVAATAAALSVHRQTLYHRLGRIERLTGFSLRTGQDRLRLHLALTLEPLLRNP